MPRKTIDITITAEGRDQGKVFVLTEMPALQAEKWATRALLALVNSGAEIPQEAHNAGMAGVAMASASLLAGGRLSFYDLEPLLDEMLQCVKVRPPNPALLPQAINPLIQDQIEEVETIIFLRMEVLKLHIDFSKAGALSERLKGMIPAAKQNSEITQTSPIPLAQ